jgi:hypothetical protein
MRIAALITVITLGQTIWREALWEGCKVMTCPVRWGRQSLRKVLHYQA